MGFFRKKVLTFFMTDDCSMRCIYCTLHSDTISDKARDKSLVLDLNFAKCAIDDYFDGDFFRPDERKGIRIFGNGEPTLQFDRVKAIVDYAASKAGDRLFVELQTNGYFSPEVANWVGGHVDLCWVSLDGTAEIQNLQRPTADGLPSFDTIDRNIRAIRQSKTTRLGLRPTTTKFNVDRQKEIVDYAKENGITVVYTDPWAYYLGRLEGQPDYLRFADQYIETYRYAKDLGIHYGTVFNANFDEETTVYCRAMLGSPQFSPDGTVSTCDMVNSASGFLASLYPELVIGKYDRERQKIVYVPENLEKIRSRDIHHLDDCKKCRAMRHCAGGCMGSGITYSGDFYGVNREYCAITKYLFMKMPETVNTGWDPSIPEHP